MKRARWLDESCGRLAAGPRTRRRRSSSRSPLDRRPAFQALEDRRLLAVTVNTPLDEADGSIVDGDVSLRDALALAPAGETINFHQSLNGGAIQLTLGELQVTRPLTIVATVLANGLTIDALGASRVFLCTAETTLRGLTITGGVAPPSPPGALHDFAGGGVHGSVVTLIDCIVEGNSAAVGGGIYGGGITIIDSTVSNNTATTTGSAIVALQLEVIDSLITGNIAATDGSTIESGNGLSATLLTVTRSSISGNTGRGINGYRSNMTITESTISGNVTSGSGGAIKFGGSSVDVSHSTIRGNSAVNGGGIFSYGFSGTITVIDSTIAENFASGNGGGISGNNRSQIFLTSSTISGNRANGSGGGILAGRLYGRAGYIKYSTITANVSDDDDNGTGSGGGVTSFNGVEVRNSIIAGNIDKSNSEHDVWGLANLRFSIVGNDDPANFSGGSGNPVNIEGSLIGSPQNPINAMLGPLADNGGLTKTHALLVGSPALNAGDPAVVAGAGGAPLYDQRGVGFPRVAGGRVDMGAFEAAPSASAPVFTSPSAVNVAENSTAVMTVTATDADLPPQTISFSKVGGADAAKFNLTAGGVLSFVAAPNFEAPTDANGDNVYVVTVQADDGNGGTTAQTISVTVTPVNEFAPAFTSPAAVNVPQNSMFVIQVGAVDADLPAPTVTYSIVGGADQAKFTITPGGVLSFVNPPHFSAPTDANGDNVYVVTVEANDNGGRTATQTISATVIDINADFGDAPDGAPGTGAGNYQTRLLDNGPRHTVVAGLKMGASVDSDDGALQDAAAAADDAIGAPDEDGVVNPGGAFVLISGAQPTVNVFVTNTTGSPATLYGWIDYNANGVFETSERAAAVAPNGTNGGVVSITFPVVPAGFAGSTYARFRLSTNVAASNPTGAAPNGEVEDYRIVSMPSADFDSDGDVDGDDLAIWRGHFGASSGAAKSMGDADADQDVDGRDFLVWQRSAGPSLPSTVNSSPAVAASVVAAADPAAASGGRPIFSLSDLGTAAGWPGEEVRGSGAMAASKTGNRNYPSALVNQWEIACVTTHNLAFEASDSPSGSDDASIGVEDVDAAFGADDGAFEALSVRDARGISSALRTVLD